MENQQLKVGMGIMIFRDGKILLGKRKNIRGHGEYAFPGGGLDHLESFEAGAHREIAEETGLEVENLKFLMVANLNQYAPLHIDSLGFSADWKSGEAVLKEPEKNEEWGWFDLDNLPTPRFVTVDKIIEAHKTGRTFFDL